MNKFFATLLALILAGACLWLWFSLDRGRSRGDRGPGSGGGQASPSRPAEVVAEPALVPAPEEVAAVPPAAAPPPDRGLAVVEDADERRALADGERVLAGRVLLPPGAPADPSLRVIGLQKDLSRREVQGDDGVLGKLAKGEKHDAVLGVTAVEADGRFELRLPREHDPVWLAVDGRFLFSPDCIPVRGAAPVPEAPVELVTELGACITGIVRPPAVDSDPVDLTGLEIALEIDSQRFSMSAVEATEVFDRSAPVDGDGRFELRALDAVHPYELGVESDSFADWTRDDLELDSGRVLEIEVQLLSGATVRGRVVDPQGQGAAGAKVQAFRTLVWSFPDDEQAEVETAADGTFSLEHVASGTAVVRAERDGFLESPLEKLELRDREVREGLTLMLEAGDSVAGKVRFEDGATAAGAEVEVGFDPAAMMGMGAMNASRGARGKATSAEDGGFEVRGLGRGPFVVKASLARKPEGLEQTWRAERSGVQPGTPDLELVLAPPCTLLGRVTDRAGQPIRKFRVQASVKSEVFFMPGESRREDFEDEQGAFAIADLTPGTWKVSVTAEGFAPGPPVEVVLPRAEPEPLVLVLDVAAGVAGTVLDPEGDPVSGAKVTVQVESSSSMERLIGRLELPETRSDERGAFLLSGLAPGTHSIYAVHAEHAASEVVPAEVDAGEVSTGLVLRLRDGAVITGEVYDARGERASGVQVVIQEPTLFSVTNLRTDAQGLFRAEHLQPGSYTVTAILSLPQDRGVDASDADSTAAFLEGMKFTMVQLEDGEEEHVVLGAPPKDPVVVKGRVTHGSGPVSEGLVSFVGEGAKGLAAFKMGSLDDEGLYEVRLDAPGRYLVQVQITGGSGPFHQHNVEFNETIPEEKEHRLDLTLPLGGISGLVRGPDRDPLGGARVTLSVDGGIETGTFMGGQYSETTTDDAGRYSFEYLRPGSYTVAAGGVLFGGAFGGGGNGGRVVRSGVHVAEGEEESGVDFELDEPGDIAGTVVDQAGMPVSGAAIFVRDTGGRLLERFSMISSGADGRFAYTGVAPGEYLVSARSGSLASTESSPVRVREGASASVQLVLLPGTELLVEILGDSDEPLRAQLSVVDPQGREMNGMIGWGEITASFTEGFSYDVQRIGPLPPGTYQVSAVLPDGRKVARPVVLDGQPERKLKLRFSN